MDNYINLGLDIQVHIARDNSKVLVETANETVAEADRAVAMEQTHRATTVRMS